MKLGTIESIWRYPVKGMRGEEIPHTYTAFTGLMGDRVYRGSDHSQVSRTLKVSKKWSPLNNPYNRFKHFPAVV